MTEIEQLREELKRLQNSLLLLSYTVVSYITNRHKIVRCEQHRLRWRLYEMANKMKVKMEREK